MSAAVDSEKKKITRKSVLRFCLTKTKKNVIPTKTKKIMETDAVPMDSNDSECNENTSNRIAHQSDGTHENIKNTIHPPNSNDVVPFNFTNAQLFQNNLRPNNQNLTVIENQQNLQFNNIRGLQIGNTYHVPRNSNNENRSNRKLTKSVLELMNSTEEVEPKVMRIAARSIGENWRMVFRDMNILDAEISQVKEQYFHINVEEVIYQLLLRWKRNSDDISIGKLITVLWNNNNYECIKELKKYYKNQKRSQVCNVTQS